MSDPIALRGYDPIALRGFALKQPKTVRKHVACARKLEHLWRKIVTEARKEDGQ